MSPTLTIALCWALFFGTHVAFGATALRKRLGSRMHLFVYVPIAWASFTLLCWQYASLRGSGAPGLGIGLPSLRTALYVVSIVGVVVMFVGGIRYPAAPMRVLRTRTSAPKGVQRITRHPFFVGLALWAGAHALLSSRMTGVAFFGGLALQAALGSWLQDRKLLARRGESYASFLAATSTIPFVAILRGKQTTPSWAEIPLVGIVAGIGASLALRHFHAALRASAGPRRAGLLPVPRTSPAR